MCRIIFISTFFLFSCLPVKAQEDSIEWAPSEATWWYGFGGLGTRNDCLVMKSIKDTIVNEKSARIIEGNLIRSAKDTIPATTYYLEGRIVIHQQGDSIFYLRRNKFELLYDFSLEAGDTMSIVTPGLIDVKYGKDTLIHYNVESTGTIELNGDILRTQKLKLFRPEGNNSSYSIGDYIIEKIGNNHFFLPYHSLGCDAYCPIPLRCYQDDSLFYKAVDYACDTTYVISATGLVPEENKIKIYPNPAQAGSEIFIDGIEVTQWYLWDIQGKLISKGSTEVGTKSIDIPPSLMTGMYFIELRSDKQRYFRKVIFN